jgi:hypothetical protein
LAAVWADHGDAIVAEHVAEHPGSRPHRWWQYSAPEPRRDGEAEVAYLDRPFVVPAGRAEAIDEGRLAGLRPFQNNSGSRVR